MEKVYITGRGLITPLGNGKDKNRESLKNGRSGIVQVPDWVERNLESQVAGISDENPECPLLDRKKLRFCPKSAVMSAAAVYEALQEAKIAVEDIPSLRIAVIGGVAGSNYREIYETTHAFVVSGKLRSISPYSVPRVMPSSAVSNLSLIYGFTGESYDISSACASSAHAVLVGSRLIAAGLYDIVVCGGAEQLDWVQALGFMAIRALSRKYNNTPAKASRPFDSERDGFVLAEGAGYVVLESEKSIIRRGVKPICQISGAAANSNATDMVAPDAASNSVVMRDAVANAGLNLNDITYINTHGTATPVGDPIEMEAIKQVFGGSVAINSTKSMTGHMIGATGAVEIIYTTMMINENFICPSINLENPEPEFSWADFVTELREGVKIKHALSNSFAFGGTNISVVISSC
ncbi:MAG: beta-ketoacyl-[acyl-carrier-protein] synthase family protein [Victivallaceae bacterium]